MFEENARSHLQRMLADVQGLKLNLLRLIVTKNVPYLTKDEAEIVSAEISSSLKKLNESWQELITPR